MRHEVDHDAIASPTWQWTHPREVEMDEVGHQVVQLEDGRVEPFDVSDLQDAVGGRGGCEHVLGVLDRARHGLLDENVRAALEQPARDVRMLVRGNGHDCGVHSADEVMRVSDGCRSYRLGQHLAALAIVVRDERDAYVRKLPQDTDVVRTHHTRADDRDVKHRKTSAQT
jgi:hypothetical protein